MSPRPARSRPGGSSGLVPTVQPIAVGAPTEDASTRAGWQVRLTAIAPNPLNRRDVQADPDAIAELAQSLREYGQMKACTIVTRAAFVAIFPEHAGTVDKVDYVHVDGARRRAAAQQAGVSDLTVTVNDDYATSRRRFIGATVAENLDRADLNPLEEAEQIAVLVEEVGTQVMAAEQLRRTPAWVTQRLNLLKLVPEVQAAVRRGELPVREVRELHRATPAEQIAALRRWRQREDSRERRNEQPGAATPPRPSRVAAPFLRLGDNRAKIAARLRAEVPSERRHAVAEELRALAEDLLRDEG